MDTQTLTTILAIFTPLLTVIVTGVSVVVGIALSRWSAREKLKVMKENAKLAVEAVEQMYWDKPNEEKKKLGLQIAQNLNSAAGIDTLGAIQLPLNEANVLSLPPSTPKEVPKENLKETLKEVLG
jgi:uncharacterized protein YneF (UPF0154 family)